MEYAMKEMSIDNLDKRSLSVLLDEFLPLLRLQKDKFIRNLGYLKQLPEN